MTKIKYICNRCGKEYYSYKEKSNYCSRDCRNKNNQFVHKCDYCGKDIIVQKNIHDKYISGKKKHIYCSKECTDKGQITRLKKVCLECGKTYEVEQGLKDTKKFCSRECYDKNRMSNSKILKKLCPVCGKEFKTYHTEQIYCCKSCRGISNRNREKCKCSYCGKEFERISSEFKKCKNHYCSKECMYDDIRWKEADIEILRNNYRKIKTKDIQNMLSKKYSIKAIRSMAVGCGFAVSRAWSDEESQLVWSNYDKLPLSDIMILLPNRTLPSIMHKAREKNLLGYFYKNNIYSDDDIEFLKSNYLSMTDNELAERLNRNANGISQKLRLLNLFRPYEIKKDGYKNLALFMRARLATWKNEVRELNSYTCCISGCRSDIIVHHCRSFNILFEETIDILNFPIYEKFDMYNDEGLITFVDTFIKLQEYYGEYVCVTKNLHVLFHKEYGYGNNTMEQWIEFSNKYKNGYYKHVA